MNQDPSVNIWKNFVYQFNIVITICLLNDYEKNYTKLTFIEIHCNNFVLGLWLRTFCGLACQIHFSIDRGTYFPSIGVANIPAPHQISNYAHTQYYIMTPEFSKCNSCQNAVLIGQETRAYLKFLRQLSLS